MGAYRYSSKVPRRVFPSCNSSGIIILAQRSPYIQGRETYYPHHENYHRIIIGRII